MTRPLKLGLFAVILALGMVDIVVALTGGGGLSSLGFVFGVLLCALASTRIWLTLRHDA